MTKTLDRQIMDSISRLNGLVTRKGADASFNESDHPRAENGQFGSGGGGKSKTDKPKKENANVVAERMAKEGKSVAEIKKALSETHRINPNAYGHSNEHALAAVASAAHAKANAKEKPKAELSKEHATKVKNLEAVMNAGGVGHYKTDKGKMVTVHKGQSGGKTYYEANGVRHGSLESMAKFWEK